MKFIGSCSFLFFKGGGVLAPPDPPLATPMYRDSFHIGEQLKWDRYKRDFNKEKVILSKLFAVYFFSIKFRLPSDNQQTELKLQVYSTLNLAKPENISQDAGHCLKAADTSTLHSQRMTEKIRKRTLLLHVFTRKRNPLRKSNNYTSFRYVYT